MNKKMRLWVAGTVGVLMTGLMSVNAYALEEKDVIGTWYVNELSMGGDILFHPGVMGMEVTVDIKEGGQMETLTSYSGEEPEADQSEWKIENDKFLITYNGETEECEYADGKITITVDGTTMILSQEKEIQKALKKKKAREIACWFESYAQSTLSFEKFETEMGKDAVRKLEKMIAKGYIRNIQIDREENYILITAPNRRVNEKIYITVTCPSCGAKNQIIKGRLCNCEYCGQRLTS